MVKCPGCIERGSPLNDIMGRWKKVHCEIESLEKRVFLSAVTLRQAVYSVDFTRRTWRDLAPVREPVNGPDANPDRGHGGNRHHLPASPSSNTPTTPPVDILQSPLPAPEPAVVGRSLF